MLPERPSDITSAAFSLDGVLLAIGQGDGSIVIADTASRSLLGEPLKGHSAAVLSLAFSPDDSTLLSGSDDATTMLWDISARSPKGQPLIGHTGGVISVLWGSDPIDGLGIILTASVDGSARIWDAASSEQRSVLRAGENALLAAAWSAERRQALTAGSDGIVRSFALAFADLRKLAQERSTRTLTQQELDQALSGRLAATPVPPRPTPQPAAASTPEPQIFTNWALLPRLSQLPFAATIPLVATYKQLMKQ